MQVVDLGDLDGDVLLYGGTYSNLQATRALFDVADALGIPPARRICTGDVAAYAADPAGTLDEVILRGGAVVAGNVERQLALGAEDCGCGFEDGSACDLLSRGWYPHAAAALAARPDLRDWCGARPDAVIFRHAGRRWAAIHGGLTDIARFLWPVSPDAAFAEEIAAVEAACGPVDAVVAGHSGLPFVRTVDRHLWLNAGAVGLPPNDGAPGTRYAVLTGAGPVIRRLAYDHAAARAAMETAGLTQGYETALVTGRWPSEDVLPPRLRRAA